MNRVKKLLHRNIKLIIVLLLFIVIGAGVTYSASSYLYNSNVIGYDNGNSGLTSTDVQGALDELYQKTSTCGECPDGYTCYKNVEVLSVFSENAVSDGVRSTYVNSDTGINFTTISSDTNGKGIYFIEGTQNEGHPIYYYRGNVINNNVLFAGFCWKMIRTTETGGIKIIYAGVPSDGKCLNTTSETASIGTSAFGTTNNYVYNNQNSAIKTFIDNWYAANMTSYTSYLEDTPFCNDMTKQCSTGTYNCWYGGYYKLNQNYSISVTTCPQETDNYSVNSANGNGLLTYPIGLITIDEAIYAGLHIASNTSNYLYVSGAVSYIMTPAWYRYGYGQFPYYISDRIGTNQESTGATSAYSVRPVVSLKTGTLFAHGDGTANNPYIVATS